MGYALTNGTTYGPYGERRSENWATVQRIHYSFVPDPTHLFQVLQRVYGRGNFYVEVGISVFPVLFATPSRLISLMLSPT